MYGYYTRFYYKGRLPDGTWMKFASESEYAEYYKEYDKN